MPYFRYLPLGQQGCPAPLNRLLKPVSRSGAGDGSSVYGSSAFLIEANGKAVLYSGDLRLHGRHPNMAARLLKALRNRTVNVLIMEGTHLGNTARRRVTERVLEGDIVRQLQRSEGLVLASFSPQHVDRLIGFINAAKRTNRTFVADVYTAFVMHLIQRQIEAPSRDGDETIRVFDPRGHKKDGKLYSMFRSRRITLDTIRRRPESYLMMFRPSMLETDSQVEILERANGKSPS